jgi:hypothetical protein
MRIRSRRRGHLYHHEIDRARTATEDARDIVGRFVPHWSTWTAVRVPAQRYRRPTRAAELAIHPRSRIDDVIITPNDVYLHLRKSSLSSFKLFCERLTGRLWWRKCAENIGNVQPRRCPTPFCKLSMPPRPIEFIASF